MMKIIVPCKPSKPIDKWLPNPPVLDHGQRFERCGYDYEYDSFFMATTAHVNMNCSNYAEQVLVWSRTPVARKVLCQHQKCKKAIYCPTIRNHWSFVMFELVERTFYRRGCLTLRDKDYFDSDSSDD